MKYAIHFKLVDDVVEHFDNTVERADPFLKSRYTGFFAVAASAVLELAFKDIVEEFAAARHKTFGQFVSESHRRLNARIKYKHIKGDHLPMIGEEYVKAFERRVVRMESYCNRKHSASVLSSYASLLTCRHQFAHEGKVPESMTYEDVKRGYLAGKAVLACLARSLSKVR